ncbi:DUF916 domain-containing protein [Lactococcus formosensis]|uniref:WxL protein peptidoglycan domain-containing protein n=1 Tax=Lactococcus formosensis TaxID=1281486 RepID=UPI0030CA5BAE
MKRLVLLVLGITMLFLPENVGAMETPSSDAMDFSAQAIPSEFQKQDKKDLSYWWLDARDQETLTLYVEIVNGKNENTFDISAHQAITNENLVIDYSLDFKDSQKYLYGKPTFDFNQKVKIGKEEAERKIQITLGANETKRVPIKLDVSEKLNAQSIGGINVSRHAKEAERTGSILNVYNRAFALILDGDQKEKTTSLQLSPSNLEVSQQGLTLINPNAKIISEVGIEAEITNASGEVVSELKPVKGVIVPQAKINLALDNKTPLVEGKQYLLKAKMTMPNKADNQNFEYRLTVDEAGKVSTEPINNKASEQRRVYLIVPAIALLLAIFAFLILKKKAKHKL